MNRISDSRTLLILCSALALSVACSGGAATGVDGGGRGGSGSGAGNKDLLGDNPSVPATCQTCLTSSTANECEGKGKNCTSDSECAALNACINNCTNINAACIANCGDAASQNAIDEWNAWTDCTCGTCATQCNATFCNIGSGSGTGTCVPDNDSCSTTEACCTFCAGDGYCGCIPSGDNGCQVNSDCCSDSCQGGYCN